MRAHTNQVSSSFVGLVVALAGLVVLSGCGAIRSGGGRVEVSFRPKVSITSR